MTRTSRIAALVLLLAAALVLAGCGAEAGDGVASAAGLPDWLRSSPPRVKEAYRYAAAHPDEVAKYPCYCGCGSMGHTSNLSCYIQNVAVDGTVTYDNHASGCGICVDITQDVMRLKAEGQSSPDVRAYIDARYSPFGPSTDTPLPTE